jgi:hypothetical protein
MRRKCERAQWERRGGKSALRANECDIASSLRTSCLPKTLDVVVWKGEEIGGNAGEVTQTSALTASEHGGPRNVPGTTIHEPILAPILDPMDHKRGLRVPGRTGKQMLTGMFRLMHYTRVALSPRPRMRFLTEHKRLYLVV